MKNMEIKKTEAVYEFEVVDSEYFGHTIKLTEEEALELRDALIEALVDTNK